MVDETLNHLIERQRVADLGRRNAQALDACDAALLRTLFAPDAALAIDGVGEFTGVDAIVGSLSVLAGLDRTQHVIGNQLVELRGDTAVMDSYFIATHVDHDHPGGPVFTVYGAYADRCVRTADGWRIARRKVQMLASTGNAAMLLPP